MSDSYEGCEPLVDADRLLRAVGRVVERVPSKWWDHVWATGGFWTAVRDTPEQRRYEGRVIEDRQFHIIGRADSPSRSLRMMLVKQPIVATAEGWLRDWQDSERERKHYVTDRPDPLIGFTEMVARALFQRLDDLEQLDPPKDLDKHVAKVREQLARDRATGGVLRGQGG